MDCLIFNFQWVCIYTCCASRYTTYTFIYIMTFIKIYKALIRAKRCIHNIHTNNEIHLSFKHPISFGLNDFWIGVFKYYLKAKIHSRIFVLCYIKSHFLPLKSVSSLIYIAQVLTHLDNCTCCRRSVTSILKFDCTIGWKKEFGSWFPLFKRSKYNKGRSCRAYWWPQCRCI